MNSKSMDINLLKNKRNKSKAKTSEDTVGIQINDDKGRLENQNEKDKKSNTIHSVSLNLDYEIKRNLYLNQEEFPKIKPTVPNKSFSSGNNHALITDYEKSDIQKKYKFQSNIFSKSEKAEQSVERTENNQNLIKVINFDSMIINNINNISNNFYLGGKNEITKKIKKSDEANKILKFLKNLAIILEGSDYCTGVGLLEGQETIYIASNKLGAYRRNYNNEEDQHILIEKAIKHLLETENLSLQNIEDYSPIADCLIQNILYHTFKKKNFLYENDREKKNLLIYLNVFFMLKRPKRQLRKLLNLNPILACRRMQNKIKRFVLALREILSSKLFPEMKKKTFQIVYASRSKVHCEMKVIDFLFREKKLKFQGIKCDSRKTLYIASSRKCCSKCVKIMETLNTYSLDYTISFPETNLINYRYAYRAPDFIRGENPSVNNPDFKNILNMSVEESKSNFMIENDEFDSEKSSTDKKPEIFSYGEHSFTKDRFINGVNNFQDSSEVVLKNMDEKLTLISEIDRELVIMSLKKLIETLEKKC